MKGDPVGLPEAQALPWVTLLSFEEVRARKEGRHPLTFIAVSFLMVPMLLGALICMVIILLILNKTFNSNNVPRASGIIFRLENPSKPRTHPGSNRPLFLKTHLLG